MRRIDSLAFALFVFAGTTNVFAQPAESKSDWMSKEQFQQLFNTRSADGLYPDELEGECQGGSEKFRVAWRRAEGAPYYTYLHMSKQAYDRLDSDLRARGYRRKSFNEFKDCAGKPAFQATWRRTGGAPRSAAPAPTVAVQSDWIPRSRYQEEFDKQVGNGFYPDETKAECQNRTERIRTLWRPLPDDMMFRSFSRMSRESFDRAEASARAKGYERKWTSEFMSCSGEQRFIALWMGRKEGKPEAAGSAAVVATASPVIGGWLTGTEFRQEFERRAIDGLYPAEIRGQCQKGAQLYRATWKEKPEDATVFSYVGMPQELYERRDTEFKARGFERVWTEQLGACAGAKTHHATWVKVPTR